MKRIFKILLILPIFLILTACPPQAPEEEEEVARPRNVIVLIADGMGTGHMEVARLLNMVEKEHCLWKLFLM